MGYSRIAFHLLFKLATWKGARPAFCELLPWIGLNDSDISLNLLGHIALKCLIIPFHKIVH